MSFLFPRSIVSSSCCKARIHTYTNTCSHVCTNVHTHTQIHLRSVCLTISLKKPSIPKHSGHWGVTQVTTKERDWMWGHVCRIWHIGLRVRMIVDAHPQQAEKEWQWYYHAVKSFLCPREKMEVSEPENHVLLLLCFQMLSKLVSWFLVLLCNLPSGSFNAEESNTATPPTPERPLWRMTQFI